MQAREEVPISAAGADGFHAIIEYPYRAATAEYGRRGADGLSANVPSRGMPAGDVRVRLSYTPAKPNCIQVGGEGSFNGAKWEVRRDQNLFLSVKGGDGGNGGQGQNGQQGGQGQRGRDATKYYDATAGGPGAPGGNGGYGTDGANGGDAGNIFITVAEDDLDTLSSVFWDLNGGKGGLSGTHGIPGEGGIGGQGGRGGRWDDRVNDHTRTIVRGNGASGPQGPPGMPPATYLSGGQSGKAGSSQVRVIKRDLTEATFPKRYMLKVVSFDVVDENEDTINEPGEHIYIRNLVVENFGGMPSPKYNPIKVAIHETGWLEPVTATFLPEEIQVGEKRKVPGEIKALIKNESAKRAPGSNLFINHEVTLIASFERLERALPEFHVGGGAPIQIQYPLQLSAPRHLDCVAKGDNVRFSWTLKNISTKSYGVETRHGRYAATRLTDPDGVFNLKYAGREGSAEDVIDELLPGAEVPIDQDFMVSSSAMEYSDSVLTLDLMLSDPSKPQQGTGSVLSARSVMTHFIKMQISGIYQYNANSRFLLVVNSGTPNKAIHQIIKFIRIGLQLEVDIFNISLTGSFIDPETNTNVLSRYEGKSIIVFGSSLPYFRAGNRNPWDLLDAWEVCRLARAGTSFLFASATDANSLHQWGSLLAFPTPNTATPSTINTENLGSLLENLKPGKLAPDSTHTYHKFTAKMNPVFGCFSNLDSTLLKSSHKAAKKLNKAYPLRRFVARPDMITDPKGASGSVIVSEGLSKSANMLMSKLPHPELQWITEYHMYTIVSCLPFNDQVRIFWNLAGQWDKAGLPSTTVYNNLPHLLESKPTDQPIYNISEKIFTAICMSIEFKIGTEITRYCDKPSWPTPISANEVMAHLPHLSQLFTITPPPILLSSTERSEFVVSTLGTIVGALQPIGFKQGWNNMFGIKIRKNQVRSQASQAMTLALGRVYTPTALSTLQKSIQAAAKGTKQAIKQTKQPDKNLSLVLRTKFDAFTNTTGAVPDDLTDGTAANYTVSKGWSRNDLQTHRQNHLGRHNKRVADEAHSKSVLAEHLNPEAEEDEDNGHEEPANAGMTETVNHQQAYSQQAYSPVTPIELPSTLNDKFAAQPVVTAVELG